jgi:hypothetical protein
MYSQPNRFLQLRTFSLVNRSGNAPLNLKNREGETT